MKRMATMTAVLAIALFLGTAAWAQTDKPEGKAKKGPGIMQADTNKDGKVTFDELKALRPKMTQERFKQLDTNGDGALDKADRPQGKPGQPGSPLFALLKDADANKDGKVTLDEAKAVRPKMTEERFKALDRDKDGVLTKEDAPKDAPEAPVKPGDKPTGKKGGKLMESDANNDGKVTFEELKADRPNLTQDEFKKMDKNGDGAIRKADHKKAS